MAAEFDFIRRYFQPLASEPEALGLRDDAALLATEPGTQLVVTTDTIVEGVHFLAEDPADSLADKLLGVNFSDVAAMGAVPLAFVLSVALPRSWSQSRLEAWLDAFAAGLANVQVRLRASLLGGDTVSSPGALVLSATAFGRVPAGKALLRSGARPGDTVFLTGTIGDAALGLAALQGKVKDLTPAGRNLLVRRYRHPDPRVGVGYRLCGVASAAIDVSDGQVADLGHLCRASLVRARVDADKLPLSVPARTILSAHPDLLSLLLTGGDDYELLFTAPVTLHEAVASVSSAAGIPISPIGTIDVPGAEPDDYPVTVRRGCEQVVLGAGGFQHFS